MFWFPSIRSWCSSLDLLKLLHCLDRIKAGMQAFQHFLQLFPNWQQLISPRDLNFCFQGMWYMATWNQGMSISGAIYAWFCPMLNVGRLYVNHSSLRNAKNKFSVVFVFKVCSLHFRGLCFETPLIVEIEWFQGQNLEYFKNNYVSWLIYWVIG